MSDVDFQASLEEWNYLDRPRGRGGKRGPEGTEFYRTVVMEGPGRPKVRRKGFWAANARQALRLAIAAFYPGHFPNHFGDDGWQITERTSHQALYPELSHKESHEGTEYAELVVWDAADEQVYLSVAAKEPQKEGDE